MVDGVLQEILWISPAPATTLAPRSATTRLLDRSLVTQLASETRPPKNWRTDAVLCAGAAGGLALFLVSLRGVDLSRMNGLGLLSALPVAAIAAVIFVALVFVLGLTLPKAHGAGLGVVLASLVVCLDGITAFIEPAPRFPPRIRSSDSSTTSVGQAIAHRAWPHTSVGPASSGSSPS